MALKRKLVFGSPDENSGSAVPSRRSSLPLQEQDLNQHVAVSYSPNKACIQTQDLFAESAARWPLMVSPDSSASLWSSCLETPASARYSYLRTCEGTSIRAPRYSPPSQTRQPMFEEEVCEACWIDLTKAQSTCCHKWMCDICFAESATSDKCVSCGQPCVIE